MNKRYLRNLPAISESEQKILRTKRVAVIGCGGLGGYIIEVLARVGVGHITAFDGDVFDETNLNRQILATEKTIGKSKVLSAKLRAEEVDPNIDFTAIEKYFDENDAAILENCDIVLDALDSPDARLTLEKVCARFGKTIVHGAIAQSTVQVCIVPAGSGILKNLYKNAGDTPKTALSFVPPICAAIQCAEAVKILLGKTPALLGKLLIYDMENYETQVITLTR